MFCNLSVWVASIRNMKKVTTFQKGPPILAFGNRHYKAHLFVSNSSLIDYTIIIRQMVFCIKIFNGFINLDLSKHIYVQSCSLPLRSKRYPCFKTMNNFESSLRKISSFGVAWEIANNLAEMGLDICDHPSTEKSALTKYFQQRTTFCFNERLSDSWTLGCDDNHC